MQLITRARRVPALRVLGLVVCVHTLGCAPGAQSSPAPYSEFQALTPLELNTVQGKLTSIGAQDGSRRSVVFCALGASVNMSLFQSEYANDQVEPYTFEATVNEIDALIDSVATLPAIVIGLPDAGGYLSFTLMYRQGNVTRSFEKIVSKSNGRALLGRLRGGLRTNLKGLYLIHSLGCNLDMLGTQLPRQLNADTEVRVKLRTLRRSRPTGELVGRVEVTNLTSQRFEGPVILALELEDPAVDFLDANGVTCVIPPGGVPYVTLPVTALEPSQTVDLTLHFRAPQGSRVEAYWTRYGGQRVGPRVFVGPGEY